MKFPKSPSSESGDNLAGILLAMLENTDIYQFTAECPKCKELRGVSCNRSQARTGEPIEVYAIHCDHTWKLTPEDSKKLRENSDLLH